MNYELGIMNWELGIGNWELVAQKNVTLKGTSLYNMNRRMSDVNR